MGDLRLYQNPEALSQAVNRDFYRSLAQPEPRSHLRLAHFTGITREPQFEQLELFRASFRLVFGGEGSQREIENGKSSLAVEPHLRQPHCARSWRRARSYAG